jgi:hypothetical protein
VTDDAAVVDDVGSLVVVTRRALSTPPAGTDADLDAYELGVYRRAFESLELLIGNHDPVYRV